MKKLSSDILFYQGLAGLIIGPIVLFFFIKLFFVHAFPAAVIPFLYVLLGVLVIRGWYGVYKARRVSFDKHFIYIGNHFSKGFIQIPISNVLNISSSFSLNNKTSGRKPYRMIYENNGKQNSVKFLKSLELFHIYNLENLVGLQQHRSVITNQGIIHDSDAIITESLKINRTTRLTAAMMDNIVMTAIFMVFVLPYMLSLIIKNQLPYSDSVLFYVISAGFALYFCKDCIGGQSIAKRILKQQVVNNKTGQIANSIRCFIRNLFMIAWPVEVIFLVINPERKLGDLVAGTKVTAFDQALQKQRPNYLQLGLCFILSYAITLAVSIPFLRY